jgi:hypothetical protein
MAKPVPEADPLEWAVKAMCEAADRVPRVSDADPSAVFAAVGETLWWIGVTDESLRSRDKASHEGVVRQALGDRPLLLGLRYARNRFTHRVDVLLYVEAAGALLDDPRGYVTAWRWRSLEPERWAELGKRGRSAEKEYDAYQETLAGVDVHRSLVDALTPLRASAWST